MPLHNRVLDPSPVRTLADYVDLGGGQALQLARKAEPEGVIGALEASGLRGRGGAGFPTGTKWQTVFDSRSDVLSATVVVNAAEGEPGTFKDRAILRGNPYRVLEGALVAATVMGSDTVIVAMKASFTQELARVRSAIDEIRAAGWCEGIEIVVVEGPSHYLYGEETALLEVIAGRNPFPRIAPPFRHGTDELARHQVGGRRGHGVGDLRHRRRPHPGQQRRDHGQHPRDRGGGAGLVPIGGHREVPGHDRVHRHRLDPPPRGGRVPHGDAPAGGHRDAGWRGRSGDVRAVMSGVANALLPGHLLDTPVTYEDLQEAGSGLGSAGFIVFDDDDDPVAVAAGASRFLAVESCGQCTPCKQDGLVIAGLLERMGRAASDPTDLDALKGKLTTVADSARCYLATQHQKVVESILALFPESVQAHADQTTPSVEPALIVPIVDLDGDAALLDEDHAGKQPDWTHDEEYSGQSPADKVDATEPIV